MNFDDITDGILRGLQFAPVVHAPRWQTVDVSQMPNLATHELLNETHHYTYRTRVKMFEYYKEHCTTDPRLQKLLTGLTGIIEGDDNEDD